MSEKEYEKIWGSDPCPVSADKKHHSELASFTFVCKCGKEPNMEEVTNL